MQTRPGAAPRHATAVAAAIRERVRTAPIYRYGSGFSAPPACHRTPAGTDAGRPDQARHRRATPNATPPAPTWRRSRSAPTGRWSPRSRPSPGCGGGAGPRALLYTGNRVRTGLDPAEADPLRRTSQRRAGPAGVPGAWRPATRPMGRDRAPSRPPSHPSPRPFGSGAGPAGISTAGIPGAGPGRRARTHYAFDSHGPGGTVRVVVIDNSLGSLAASDPHQNPPEAQLPWLVAVLGDARARGIPVIVMGSRSLNTSFTPEAQRRHRRRRGGSGAGRGRRLRLSLRPPRREPCDADPGGRHRRRSPASARGTLGYRSQVSGAVGLQTADALFGDSAVMLLEIGDPERRHQRRAGRRAADPGDRRPLARGDGRDPSARSQARPSSAGSAGVRGRRSLGPGVRRIGEPEPVRRRPLHAVPARTVPGRRLLGTAESRVQLHLLRSRHRRLRPPGPRTRPTCASPISTPTTRS